MKSIIKIHLKIQNKKFKGPLGVSPALPRAFKIFVVHKKSGQKTWSKVCFLRLTDHRFMLGINTIKWGGGETTLYVLC